MLRGHIDRVSNERIEGWLSLEGYTLREETVLAFIGVTCVGQGTVNVFRQDLADARIGDGWAGFSFAVQLQLFQDPCTVLIRLANSDAYIFQPGQGAKELNAGQSTSGHPYPAPVDLNWMRSKGWISDVLHQRLRILSAFGVLELSLYKTEDFFDNPLADSRLNEVLVEIFDVLVRRPHVLSSVRIDDERQLRDVFARHRREFSSDSHFAVLCTSERLPISVIEGSYWLTTQVVSTLAEEISSRGVEYSTDCNRILFMNLKSAYSIFSTARWPKFTTAVIPEQLK